MQCKNKGQSSNDVLQNIVTFQNIIKSVIMQKGEFQSGCFKKTKLTKFSEKTFLTPCAYQGVRNICFFRKFGMLCFLETPVLKLVLLPYYRRSFVLAAKSAFLKIGIDENDGAYLRFLGFHFVVEGNITTGGN